VETIQTNANFSNSIYFHNFSRRLMFSELEFSDQFHFMWSWFWRGVCITILVSLCAMIAGGIVGAMFGIVAVILHKDIHAAMGPLRMLGFAVGLIVGFAGLFPLINWLTKATFGNYELWIVKTRDE